MRRRSSRASHCLEGDPGWTLESMIYLCLPGYQRCHTISSVLQEEDNHALEEILGFPLLKEGTRLGWLMNLNSVSHSIISHCQIPH